MTKITCPKCGDDLEEQLGYKGFGTSHTCSRCGASLTRDSMYADDWDVYVPCPRCGANLGDNGHFTYIKCSECGAQLKRIYGDEYEVIDDDDDDDSNYSYSSSDDGESDFSFGDLILPLSIIAVIIFYLLFWE